MTDELFEPATDVPAVRQPLFSVDVEPPSVLHLAGELDVVGAPALAGALVPLTSRGGTIGMDLAELTFMDSSGINALCRAAEHLGGRGRIVVLHVTPSVRRVIEIAGIVGVVDVNDDPADLPSCCTT